MSSPPEDDSDETNPILVFGEDYEEHIDDEMGITLCSKQPSFRNIAKHIPRGYNSMKNMPRNPIKRSEVIAHRSQLSAKEEMLMRNSSKWEVLGYDPKYGKGDMGSSLTLYSFRPKVLRELQASDAKANSGDPVTESRSVGLSLRRIDSVFSGRYGSGIVDTSKIDSETYWSLIHGRSESESKTKIKEQDMNIDLLTQYTGQPKIDICSELSKYDEDFTGDDSMIPSGLKQMITHPKTCVVYRVLCQQHVSNIPKDDIELIIEVIRTYMDLALNKNLLPECDYLDKIIDSLMTSLQRSDRDSLLDEAAAEYQRERDRIEQEFSIADAPCEPSEALLSAQEKLDELVTAKKYDESVTLAKKIRQLKEDEAKAAARQYALRYSAAIDELDERYRQKIKQIEGSSKKKPLSNAKKTKPL